MIAQCHHRTAFMNTLTLLHAPHLLSVSGLSSASFNGANTTPHVPLFVDLQALAQAQAHQGNSTTTAQAHAFSASSSTPSSGSASTVAFAQVSIVIDSITGYRMHDCA